MQDENLLDAELMNVMNSRKGFQTLEGREVYWDCGNLYVAPKAYIASERRKKHMKQLGRELVQAFRDNALYLAGMAILAYLVINAI